MKEFLDYFPRASAKMNEQFILIETHYGGGRGAVDSEAPKYFFDLEIDDASLGKAVITSLQASRRVAINEIQFLFDYKKMEYMYNKNVASIIKIYGYKNKSQIFRRMRSVGINKEENFIKLVPTIHERGAAWRRDQDDGIEDVIIPFSSTPTEVGAALRLAFSRCEGNV